MSDYLKTLNEFLSKLPDPSIPRLALVKMTDSFMESLNCSVYYRGTTESGYFKLGHPDWMGVPIELDNEIEIPWIAYDQFKNEMTRAKINE